MEALAIICIITVLINVGIATLVFKLYTEYWKERIKSQTQNEK